MADRPRRPLWRRILELLDDILPMSPDDRDRRHGDGRDHTAYQRRRIHLHLFEKRGKGGYR